jgi:hypothetical protein
MIHLLGSPIKKFPPSAAPGCHDIVTDATRDYGGKLMTRRRFLRVSSSCQLSCKKEEMIGGRVIWTL